MKVKLIAIAKDESLYIPGWFFHHKYFGFDEIHVHLNNCTDNSKEICKALNDAHTEFSYSMNDQDFKFCEENKLNFQQYIYTRALQKEIERGEVSHIMFLDLDEYWTPRNLRSTIKQFLKYRPYPDSISFAWHYDQPRQSGVNAFPCIQQQIQKNRHLKTCVRLSERIKMVGIHNHVIDNGLQTFWNGADLSLECTDHSQPISLVSEQYFALLENSPDEFFIYHTVYRTVLEFLTSLLRTNQQAGSKLSLKQNRWGYMPSTDSNPTTAMCFARQALIDYGLCRERLLSDHRLKEQLRIAELMLFQRYCRSLDTIHQLEKAGKLLPRLTAGLNINNLERDFQLRWYFDSVHDDLEGLTTYLVGWAYCTSPLKCPDISVQNVLDEAISVDITYSERSDVSSKFGVNNAAIGFTIKITRAHSAKVRRLIAHENYLLVHFTHGEIFSSKASFRFS